LSDGSAKNNPCAGPVAGREGASTGRRRFRLAVALWLGMTCFIGAIVVWQCLPTPRDIVDIPGPQTPHPAEPDTTAVRASLGSLTAALAAVESCLTSDGDIGPAFAAAQEALTGISRESLKRLADDTSANAEFWRVIGATETVNTALILVKTRRERVGTNVEGVETDLVKSLSRLAGAVSAAMESGDLDAGNARRMNNLCANYREAGVISEKDPRSNTFLSDTLKTTQGAAVKAAQAFLKTTKPPDLVRTRIDMWRRAAYWEVYFSIGVQKDNAVFVDGSAGTVTGWIRRCDAVRRPGNGNQPPFPNDAEAVAKASAFLAEAGLAGRIEGRAPEVTRGQKDETHVRFMRRGPGGECVVADAIGVMLAPVTGDVIAFNAMYPDIDLPVSEWRITDAEALDIIRNEHPEIESCIAGAGTRRLVIFSKSVRRPTCAIEVCVDMGEPAGDAKFLLDGRTGRLEETEFAWQWLIQ
jgi:hypothetical protein